MSLDEREHTSPTEARSLGGPRGTKVPAAEWEQARAVLDAEEQALDEARLALAAKRRRMPMTPGGDFLRDGDAVHRTYFLQGAPVEAIGSADTRLELTPYGGRRR